jgi:hypothetical protein
MENTMTSVAREIRIEDLPTIEQLTPEDMQRIFGAGMKPQLRVKGPETLEDRLVMTVGLVGHYKFDNPVNLGQDSSGRGNDLVVVGTPEYSTQAVSGGAMRNSGGGNYLTQGGAFTSSLPTGNSPYTIGMWLNPDSDMRQGLLSMGTAATSQANSMTLLSDGRLVNYWISNDLAATPPTNLAIGTGTSGWHHIVATYDPALRACEINASVKPSDQVIPRVFWDQTWRLTIKFTSSEQ